MLSALLKLSCRLISTYLYRFFFSYQSIFTALKIKVNPQLNPPWLLICPWYSYHIGEKSWSEHFWHFQACSWDNEEKAFCYIVKLYTKWSWGLKKNPPLLLMTSKKIYKWEDSESVESLQMSRQKPEISSKMTLTLIFW